MVIQLENLHLQLQLNARLRTFSVSARQRNGLRLLHARVALYYRVGRLRTGLSHRQAFRISPEERVSSIHGEMRTRRLLFGPDNQGVRFEVCFGVTDDRPFLFWQAVVHNQGRRSIQVERIEVLRLGFSTYSRFGLQPSMGEYSRGSLHFGIDHPDPAFFSNGWGSWNYSGVYGLGDRFRRTRLGPFTSPMRVNPGTPQPRAAGHFASDMFALLGDRRGRSAFLIGFLSQRRHFGSIEALINPLTPAVSMWANGDRTILDPGDSMQADWACLQFLHLDTPDPLGAYLEAAARENRLELQENGGRAGWCSWYQYFQEISPMLIRHNLEAASREASRIPIDLLQIDDGWQAQVGDWEAFSPAFLDGPAPLAAEIRASGLAPGLWLAPFIVSPRSRFYREHPDWILRGAAGLPVNAGYNWGRFNRALDLSLPGALDHACSVVHRAAHDWGYSFLKLDFLYAGALPGRRHDPRRTRAEVLRAGLEALRETAGPETDLLGCGVPLGSALGLFEAMRIGADVAPYWAPRVYKKTGLFRSEPDLPAARNAVQNALTRAPFHQRWWANDPDCVLLRPESDLTRPEIQTIASVAALTGGLLMISDDLAGLPESSLRMAQTLLPPLDRRPLVLDWFDAATPARLRLDLEGTVGAWHLAALFNWEDQPNDLVLDLRDFHLDTGRVYIGRDFWSGRVWRIDSGGMVFPDVPPHGCLLLALRLLGGAPLYLGSDLHISQGLEVSIWDFTPEGLRLGLERPGRVEGRLDFWLPEGFPCPADLEQRAPNLYRLPVQFEKSLDLEIDTDV